MLVCPVYTWGLFEILKFSRIFCKNMSYRFVKKSGISVVRDWLDRHAFVDHIEEPYHYAVKTFWLCSWRSIVDFVNNAGTFFWISPAIFHCDSRQVAAPPENKIRKIAQILPLITTTRYALKTGQNRDLRSAVRGLRRVGVLYFARWRVQAAINWRL